MIAITSLTLHGIVPENNMRRWYRLDVQSDLFGYQRLVREWGRIGRSGQACIVPYPTITEAQAAESQEGEEGLRSCLSQAQRDADWRSLIWARLMRLLSVSGRQVARYKTGINRGEFALPNNYRKKASDTCRKQGER